MIATTLTFCRSFLPGVSMVFCLHLAVAQAADVVQGPVSSQPAVSTPSATPAVAAPSGAKLSVPPGHGPGGPRPPHMPPGMPSKPGGPPGTPPGKPGGAAKPDQGIKPISPPRQARDAPRPERTEGWPGQKGPVQAQFQRPAVASGAAMVGRSFQDESRLAGASRRLSQSQNATQLHDPRGAGPDQPAPARPRIHAALRRRIDDGREYQEA